MHGAAAALYHLPGSALAARWLPPSQALRCVLFHQIADQGCPFTDGLDVRVTVQQFVDHLDFLQMRYSFVDLDQILAGFRLPAPRPPVLLTFDDSYRNIVEIAAPLCAARGIPAVFFVNGATVGNGTLALDNLIAYVVNCHGMGVVERLAAQRFTSPADVPRAYVSTLTLPERTSFQRRLAEAAGVDPGALAAGAGLYVNEAHLVRAAEYGMEVANHTWSHVHCRGLTAEELDREVAENRRWLEARTGRAVRAFSYPYGQRADAPPDVTRCVERSGHRLSVFAEAYPNRRVGPPHQYDRVTLYRGTDAETFRDIELRPRARAARRLVRDRAPVAGRWGRRGRRS